MGEDVTGGSHVTSLSAMAAEVRHPLTFIPHLLPFQSHLFKGGLVYPGLTLKLLRSHDDLEFPILGPTQMGFSKQGGNVAPSGPLETCKRWPDEGAYLVNLSVNSQD